MGVYVSVDNVPTGSAFDRWILYRATSKTGTYSAVNGATGQATTDLTYYDEGGTSTSWYKVAYYNSSTAYTSPQSDAMQGQATTYTTVKKVERFLMLPALTDSTTPTLQDVTDLINRAEDAIDYRTGHSWRLRYSGTVSGQDQTAAFEYHDIDFLYEQTVGTPVYLNHRQIRSFSAAAGDAIDVWDGTNFVDWLGTKTEGRANDFWVDYALGIFYIRTWYLRGPQRIRFKYRYGETYVNKIVEDVATKFVAVDVLSGMQMRGVIAVEGSLNTLSHESRINLWSDQAEFALQGLKEFKIPSIQL